MSPLFATIYLIYEKIRRISWEKCVLGVTISLDGFAEDIDGSVGALYPGLELLHTADVLKESIQKTGAVLMA